MSTTVAAPLRIGDVAREVGITTRTIRYYEEIGLLGGVPGRAAGSHRAYTEADVQRLGEVVRLKDLLGVTLEELKELIAAQDARAAVRAELRAGVAPARRRVLLAESLGHIERQLELVRHRRNELDTLEGELAAKRKLVRRKLRELDAG